MKINYKKREWKLYGLLFLNLISVTDRPEQISTSKNLVKKL